MSHGSERSEQARRGRTFFGPAAGASSDIVATLAQGDAGEERREREVKVVGKQAQSRARWRAQVSARVQESVDASLRRQRVAGDPSRGVADAEQRVFRSVDTLRARLKAARGRANRRSRPSDLRSLDPPALRSHVEASEGLAVRSITHQGALACAVASLRIWRAAPGSLAADRAQLADAT